MFSFEQFQKFWGATSKTIMSSAKMPLSAFRVIWTRKPLMDFKVDFFGALIAFSSRKHCKTN